MSQPDGPSSKHPQPRSSEPSPPHTPQASSTKVEPHVLSQPDGPSSKHPQPRSSEPSPPHTPQASSTKVEPQVLSQPDGPSSKHPQPRSSEPSPPHTPQASSTYRQEPSSISAKSLKLHANISVQPLLPIVTLPSWAVSKMLTLLISIDVNINSVDSNNSPITSKLINIRAPLPV